MTHVLSVPEGWRPSLHVMDGTERSLLLHADVPGLEEVKSSGAHVGVNFTVPIHLFLWATLPSCLGC